MNVPPLISVIMSVYNGEQFLQEAVDSILKQTFADFEFIIIEDASTDNTQKLLEQNQLNDSRIKIIKKEKNKGPAGFIQNLNIGLENATGKYIARMDADDISTPDRFQKQVNFLEKNPQTFLVGSQVQCIDESGDETKILRAPGENKTIRKKMLKNISLFHPVIMFRNIPEIHYREKMLYCEDYDLYFRLMLGNYKFANIKRSLLKYRILDNSISRKDNKFIKWLFVEKSRQFFREQKKTGTDSYDQFEPENFLNILVSDFVSKKVDLLFAAKTAFKFKSQADLEIILNKATILFPQDFRFRMYKIYLKISKSVFS